MNSPALQPCPFPLPLPAKPEGWVHLQDPPRKLTRRYPMAEITVSGPQTVFPDFRKIALLAKSIQLLRGHEEGRDLENWWEAAAFWQKQMANPLSALPRFRHR